MTSKERMLKLAANLRETREARDMHYDGSLERQINSAKRDVYQEIAAQIEAAFNDGNE